MDMTLPAIMPPGMSGPYGAGVARGVVSAAANVANMALSGVESGPQAKGWLESFASVHAYVAPGIHFICNTSPAADAM